MPKPAQVSSQPQDSTCHLSRYLTVQTYHEEKYALNKQVSHYTDALPPSIETDPQYMWKIRHKTWQQFLQRSRIGMENDFRHTQVGAIAVEPISLSSSRLW